MDHRSLPARFSALPGKWQPVARRMSHWLWDDSYMGNTIRDFPSHQFKIVGFCGCGHSAAIDLASLPGDLPIDTLRGRLRCSECGGRGISIRIAWIAAGGFKHSAPTVTKSPGYF